QRRARCALHDLCGLRRGSLGRPPGGAAGGSHRPGDAGGSRVFAGAGRHVAEGWGGVGMKQRFVVAEIGCNHRGDFHTAQDMVRVAAQVCGVDVVKFQKRNPRECLTPEQYYAPHPVPENAYGATYGQHREALELDLEAHRRLKALCEEWGVMYSSSVWDMTSARQIASLQPALIKI